MKDRILSTYEFYEIIQIEYICCILRARIYKAPKDKNYWNRVADGKKTKIETISERNKLPSIFNDTDLLNALNRRVFKENTHPIFRYKNSEQRLSQEYYDLLYYYNIGSEVRVYLGDEPKVGKIIKYKPFDENIIVLVDNQEYSFPIDNVIRIL